MRNYLFGFLLLVPSVSDATVYWAAVGGNNAAVCTAIDSVGTPDAPGTDPGSYGTISRAAECATVAGDVVNIKNNGEYTGANNRIDTAFSSGTVTAAGLKSGTGESVRTYIQGDPSGARPTVSGGSFYCTFKGAARNWITIRHLTLDESETSGACAGTIGIEGTNVTVTDVEILNSAHNNIIIGTSCISVSCTHTESQYAVISNSVLHGGLGSGNRYGIYNTQNNVTIDRVNFYDFKGYAIHNYSDFGPVNNATISRNYIHGAAMSTQSGYAASCTGVITNGSGTVVTRNVIDLSTCEAGADVGSSHGIWVGFQASASVIATHNLIYAPRGHGLRIGSSPTGAQVFQNNIVFGQAGSAISNGSSAVVTNTHNACAASANCATSNKITIAALTSITVSLTDFTHKVGSLGIDQGVIRGDAFNGAAPDLGPFETLLFSSCQVPVGAATKIQATFVNNVAPPLLPSSGATTFTARKNAASNPLSGLATRVGDNILELTVTNSYIGGDAADISWVSGNLTDSSLIGGELNQKYLTSLTNQSCANNLAGVAFTFTQAGYEWHSLYGLEPSPIIRPLGSPSTGAAENISRMVMIPGGSIRLRFAITCTGADCPATGFVVRYARNGGSYTALPDGYTADNVAFCGVLSHPYIPANVTATTNQLSTAGTFVPGAILFTTGAIPSIDLAQNGKTEMEYCIKTDADTSANDTFDFRVYRETGEALTYSVTPRLTIVEPMAGF